MYVCASTIFPYSISLKYIYKKSGCIWCVIKFKRSSSQHNATNLCVPERLNGHTRRAPPRHGNIPRNTAWALLRLHMAWYNCLKPTTGSRACQPQTDINSASRQKWYQLRRDRDASHICSSKSYRHKYRRKTTVKFSWVFDRPSLRTVPSLLTPFYPVLTEGRQLTPLTGLLLSDFTQGIINKLLFNHTANAFFGNIISQSYSIMMWCCIYLTWHIQLLLNQFIFITFKVYSHRNLDNNKSLDSNTNNLVSKPNIRNISWIFTCVQKINIPSPRVFDFVWNWIHHHGDVS